MTPEAQRIAIAEACGWQDFYTEANEFRGTPPGTWAYSNRTVYQDGSAPVPDYLNDLNAMHEAGKVLPDLYAYQLELIRVCEKTDGRSAWRATASQRAEAFLRTLNLWVEPTTATKGE